MLRGSAGELRVQAMLDLAIISCDRDVPAPVSLL